MLPTYQNGDLVVIQAAPVYVAGDAVAYRVPSGENNNAVDPWMPRTTDIAGRSWAVVPRVGRLVTMIHQPVVAGGLAAGVMVSLILAGQSRPKRARTAGRAP